MGHLLKRALMALFLLAAQAAPPLWVHETAKACARHQLCALGEGKDYQQAASNARLELARVFGTRLKGSVRLERTVSNESFYEEIQEDTDEMLKGATIERHHKAKDRVYALAVLDKNKQAARLGRLIKEMDQKLQQRQSPWQLKKVFHKRQALNERYEVLKGRSLRSPATLEEILSSQKKLFQSLRVSLSPRGPRASSLAPIIEQVLTEMGLKIVNEKAHYQVQINYHSEPLHFNVEGFEKHRFTLELRALNTKGEVVGTSNFTTDTIGRNAHQASSKTSELIKKHLFEHMGDLNIRPLKELAR